MTSSVSNESRIASRPDRHSGGTPPAQNRNDSQLRTGQFPVSPVTSTITGPAGQQSSDDDLPQNTNDVEHSDHGSYVSVWGPFVRLLIGLAIVIAGLTWSLHFDGAIDRFGYVPVMLVYLIIMIIGGGTMVSGAKTLWTRLTTAS